MKIEKIVCVVLIAIGAVSSSCNRNGEAARDAAVQQIQQPQNAAAAPASSPGNAQPAAAAAEPAQNAAGVWHYTCPKGCAGGAGSATACAKCGTTLAHNQAYHAGNNTTPAMPQPIKPKEGGNDHAGSVPAGFIPVESPLKNKETAQNAKGVWHYTCPSGCAGGSGLAIACPKCGKTMVHNQAYHQ
ncbi:MAG: hypothetical protein IT258_14210 [Saprospiraceae bacterium]|nr:hypothetical protein [Saprospiraceae bacterium]